LRGDFRNLDKTRNALASFDRPLHRRESTISIERIADLLQMIPDTEAACQTSEAAVDNGDDVYGKIKDRPEKEAASVTAWKRYQRLVAAMESRGGEFNRKSVIEAIFRGSDLVYVSH